MNNTLAAGTEVKVICNEGEYKRLDGQSGVIEMSSSERNAYNGERYTMYSVKVGARSYRLASWEVS